MTAIYLCRIILLDGGDVGGGGGDQAFVIIFLFCFIFSHNLFLHVEYTEYLH